MNCRQDHPSTPAVEQLTCVDPQWLGLHNRLHRHREIWTGQWAGRDVRVQWGGGAMPAATTVELLLSLGDSAIQLQLPVSALGIFGAGLNVQSLAGVMLLELALLPLIEPLEQLTGEPIRLIDRDDPEYQALATQGFDLNLNLQAWLDDSPLPVALQLTVAAAEKVAQWLEQHAIPARLSLGALILRLAVETGEAKLSIGELRSLNPGDVLMLDPWPATQMRLVLARQLQARATRHDTTLTLLEAPTGAHYLKELAMSETLDGPSLDSSLDELPLKLVCQAGSVELTLAQLRELGEGSLVQFADQRQDSVDLMVAGRRVGQGQLVRIGDGLGIRVLSIAAP